MEQHRLSLRFSRWAISIALLVLWTASCQPPPGGIRLSIINDEDLNILSEFSIRSQQLRLGTVIPEEWRAESEPHYELLIRTELAGESPCVYTVDYERVEVERERLNYHAAVTRLEDGEVIAERTFEGLDPLPCDSLDFTNRAYSSSILADVGAKSIPLEVIRGWLEQTLPTVTALPTYSGTIEEQRWAGVQSVGGPLLFRQGDSMWMATGSQRPRYLVHAASYEHVIEACAYGYPIRGGAFFYIFRTRGYVQLTLIDLTTGDTVAQAGFAGSPSESCPDEVERSFLESRQNTTTEGSEMPSIAELETWLAEQLTQLPDARPVQ